MQAADLDEDAAQAAGTHAGSAQLLEPLNLQIKIVVDSAGLQFNQNVSGNLYLPIFM